MATVSNDLLLEWITYKPASAGVLLFWVVGNPTIISVAKNQTITWKTIGQAQSGKTFEWSVGQVTATKAITWSVAGFGTPRGNPEAPFWAVHTGEANSGQVIRFRNATNIDQIVWESAVESNPRGQIRCYIAWEDPNNQQYLQITQTLYSDWKVNAQGLPTGLGYNTIRPTDRLGKNTLPFYVFQEYKSTTDLKYAIRYLGYVVNPFSYYNGPRRPYKIEEIVNARGACVFSTNHSGQPFNVTIRFRSGHAFSGILPDKAAIAVIKNDNGNFQVGYVPNGGLPVYAGPNIAFDPAQIKRNFLPFQ